MEIGRKEVSQEVRVRINRMHAYKKGTIWYKSRYGNEHSGLKKLSTRLLGPI